MSEVQKVDQCVPNLVLRASLEGGVCEEPENPALIFNVLNEFSVCGFSHGLLRFSFLLLDSPAPLETSGAAFRSAFLQLCYISLLAKAPELSSW